MTPPNLEAINRMQESRLAKNQVHRSHAGEMSEGDDHPRTDPSKPAIDMARYLADRAELVEQALAREVAQAEGAAARLHEAMRYSLFAGGKRLRPVLTLAACEAVGGKIDQALGFACAIEMIHTYSLVHDDLPCMDDDDLRRGRPTNHKVFGEAIATLAGDGLLTDAFSVLVRYGGRNGVQLDSAAILETVAELAEAAGSQGMVGGQVIDLLCEGQPMRLDELELLHGKKTGALFVAAVCCGARMGGANQLQLDALREYAKALGLAFQVVDDLLDVEASTESMGKRTGKDERRGKATYPSLLGVERSREFAHELAGRACRAIEGFDKRADPLRALAAFAVERTQ